MMRLVKIKNKILTTTQIYTHIHLSLHLSMQHSHEYATIVRHLIVFYFGLIEIK